MCVLGDGLVVCVCVCGFFDPQWFCVRARINSHLKEAVILKFIIYHLFDSVCLPRRVEFESCSLSLIQRVRRYFIFGTHTHLHRGHCLFRARFLLWLMLCNDTRLLYFTVCVCIGNIICVCGLDVLGLGCAKIMHISIFRLCSILYGNLWKCFKTINPRPTSHT